MTTSVIGTSTISLATGDGPGRRIDRCQNGVIWAFFNTNDFFTWSPRYSTDNGATWTAIGTQSGVSNASVFIDLDDYCHVVWKQNGTTGPNNAVLSSGFIYYMRGTPNAGRTNWTWSTARAIASNTNANFPDVVACRNGTGWEVFTVYSVNVNPNNYATYLRLSLNSAGTITSTSSDGLSQSDIGTGGTLGVTFNNTHTYPTIDFNHTGDGKTVANGVSDLYVGWTTGSTANSSDGIRFRKAVNSGGTWSWRVERAIDSTVKVSSSAGEWLNCFFDGTRVILAGFLSSSTVNSLRFYERDPSDTTGTTTQILLPAPLAGSDYLFSGSSTYNNQGDIYFFGRDLTGNNGTRKVNYRKWTRDTNALGPITTLDTTGPNEPFISVKRGFYTNIIELIRTDNTTSPFNVVYDNFTFSVIYRGSATSNLTSTSSLSGTVVKLGSASSSLASSASLNSILTTLTTLTSSQGVLIQRGSATITSTFIISNNGAVSISTGDFETKLSTKIKVSLTKVNNWNPVPQNSNVYDTTNRLLLTQSRWNTATKPESFWSS